MYRYPYFIFCLCIILMVSACEDTDVTLATSAGIDAVKAVTLSDTAIRQIAKRSANHADKTRNLAPPGNPYARRLKNIVGDQLQIDGITFNCRVYLAHEINAFAMADGTIRIYSGLMDILDNEELRFVVGHEMGHVAGKHINKKIQLAYATRALRKGIASMDSGAGEVARSRLGGFVETVMNAQFSQLEEKEADDYGLNFIKNSGGDPKAAVSALNKLASLGNNHSFLSSHPAPGERAERLRLQLEGKSESIEGKKQGIINKIKGLLTSLLQKRQDFINWMISIL